jgi:photosystem II stability/assembly factor-like uncharacterized protein
MKNFILQILVLFYSLFITNYSFSQSGWFLQNGITSNTLTGVYLINQTTGYLTGFNGTILKTTNFGNNWYSQNSGVSTDLFSTVFTDTQTGWCFGGISPDGYILKTTNSGQNWIQNYHTTNLGSIFKGVFLAGNIGYCGTLFGYILKTTNFGINWKVVYSNTYGSGFYQCFFVDQNTGWFVGNNGLIINTIDGGNNWISQNGNTANGLFGVYFTSSSTGFTVGANGTILKTTNGGQNWIAKTGITTLWLNCIHFINNNTGWIIGGNTSNSESIILRTDNCGENWMTQYSPTTNRLTYIHCYNAQNGIIVGLYGALLKTTTGGSTFIIKTSKEIPEKFSLLQNYPNPFNPTTSIKYQVESIRHIKLVVFDIQGKELETLVNEKQSPGTYEVTFDGSKYTSGVYFYKISAEDYSETRRMILIK